MSETGKEEKIELIPVRTIKPLPLEVTTIGREEETMLRNEMATESQGLYRIDPIRLRKLTPEEKEECKEKYLYAEYEVVDGHKRLRIAQELHWQNIRAIVMDILRDEALELNYRKNKERGTIDSMLEALYFKHLYVKKNLPASEIADMHGMSEREVRRILQRVKITKEATRMVLRKAASGKPLSARHLEVIGSTPEEKQIDVTEAIVEGRLTAKQAEKAKKAIEKGLPKDEAVKAAKASTPPVGEIEIGEVKCSECGGLQLKILHISDGKHKIKKA
jgi:ParB/RepB/Spo0J family partition protein